MSEELPRKILARWEKMKAMRGTWETHWQEIADHMLTRKATITTTRYPGEKRNLQIFNSAAVMANELLAGALHGLLTNPSVQWFELTTGDQELDDNDEVRLWLQKVTRDMHNILNNSNFQEAIHEIYVDLGAFGTAALSIMEDEDMVVRFTAHPIEEFFIDENHKNRVDTVFRRFKWTTRQIMQEFPNIDNEFLIDEMKKDPARKFDVIHAIFPANEMEELQMQGKNFASVWMLVDKLMVLSKNGFREMPFAVPRWTKATGEIYGRSPAMKALPDIKMINEMMKTTIKGAQKTVDPPIMMPDDGFFMPVRTLPGGINYFRSGTSDRIEPLITNARVDFGLQMIEFVQKAIRDAFFIDQLQLQDGPQMTATEVLQRTEENMRLLGPILGRQQSELLSPLVDRLFDVMLKRGVVLKEEIPEALRELKDGRFKVQYNSLVARAQRSQEAQNILRTVEASAPFINTDPTIMDNFDGDAAVRIISKLFGVPQEVIRNKREIAGLREARQEAAQAEQEAQAQTQALQDAQVGAQAAATVSNI